MFRNFLNKLTVSGTSKYQIATVRCGIRQKPSSLFQTFLGTWFFLAYFGLCLTSNNVVIVGDNLYDTTNKNIAMIVCIFYFILKIPSPLK